ncbi:DNA mobilization endonuclease VirD1/MobC family subunit [Acuticoccus sp. I52.16.1]|uniref:DNA mobilization endonuclease VirD1/MobC family subunit n=1 Tax=Acuticoccus sp. I52.16.1 TaxID=2928472 RepID=UPI001FD0D8E6|nr:DNA mobilization endonuclease VirD1/MobC family subunit [Acuticoccus sp. I52.16.1]UOM37039.1 DNA mobilization endonuclease VirD1/MobC family subunit [Acuticoccus sp. I52.16.1]
MTDHSEGQTSWPNRRLSGGAWKSDAPSTTRERAEKTISVKMTEAELVAFDAAIAQVGLKRNRALRIAARRIGGFLEADAETLAVLKDLQAQIAGIARNVNQIAKAANRTLEPDYRAFMEERRDLGKALSRLDSELRTITETATRRTDGEARLRRASSS